MNVALQQNSRTSSQRGRLFLLLGKRGGLKTSKGATIAKEFSSIKTSSRKDAALTSNFAFVFSGDTGTIVAVCRGSE